MLRVSTCEAMIGFVFLQAFAIFCGLGIHNAQMYEQACKLLAKQTVAMEVLINLHLVVTLCNQNLVLHNILIIGDRYLESVNSLA